MYNRARQTCICSGQVPNSFCVSAIAAGRVAAADPADAPAANFSGSRCASRYRAAFPITATLTVFRLRYAPSHSASGVFRTKMTKALNPQTSRIR